MHGRLQPVFLPNKTVVLQIDLDASKYISDSKPLEFPLIYMFPGMIQLSK